MPNYVDGFNGSEFRRNHNLAIERGKSTQMVKVDQSASF